MNYIKKTTIVTLPLVLLTNASQGATLARYLYDSTSTSQAATSVDAGVNASDFTSTLDGTDIRSVFGGADLPTANNWKVANHNVDASADVGVSGTPGTSYLGFSLTAANPGETIDLDTFTFEWGAAKDGGAKTSGDANYRLFYSIDGGTSFTNLGTDAIDFSVNNIPADGTFIAPTASIDLSSIGAQTDIELRLHSWSVDGAANTSTIMRNFEFSGDVNAVPEPSTFVLLGLGSLAGALRRRR